MAVRLLWNGDQTTMRMEVIDSGPGIPAIQRDRLFEAFERMDEASTKVTEGVGLGLMISARLIGAMGGRIGYDENAERRRVLLLVRIAVGDAGRAGSAANPGGAGQQRRRCACWSSTTSPIIAISPRRSCAQPVIA